MMVKGDRQRIQCSTTTTWISCSLCCDPVPKEGPHCMRTSPARQERRGPVRAPQPPLQGGQAAFLHAPRAKRPWWIFFFADLHCCIEELLAVQRLHGKAPGRPLPRDHLR